MIHTSKIVCTGTPGIKLPMALMMGFSIVGVAPPLIQYAILRPQVKRISVAIIGWMPKTETSVPLKEPKTMATAQQARNAPRIEVKIIPPGIGRMRPANRPMTAPHEAYLVPPVILVNQAGTT